MTQYAELADGTRLEFPDEATPQVIQATVKRMVSGQSQPAQAPAADKSLPPHMQAYLARKAEFDKSHVDPMYDLGGRATDFATKLGAPPEVAASVGVAANLLPSLLTGGSVGRAAAPALEAAGRDVMQRALKPLVKDFERTGLNQGESVLQELSNASAPVVEEAGRRLNRAQSAVQTMLDEGINVTRGGIQELTDRISRINSAVSQRIGGSTSTVGKGEVASRIQDVIQRVERTNPTPQAARNAVETVYDEFMGNHLIPDNIPVQWAQQLKQGIYETLRDAYGRLGAAGVEAQKALARGFKETIERAHPEVGPDNAAQARLLEALKVAERRVAVQGNRDIGGLAFMPSTAERVATMLADRSPLVKSLLARFLYSGAEGTTALGATAAVADAEQMRSR